MPIIKRWLDARKKRMTQEIEAAIKSDERQRTIYRRDIKIRTDQMLSQHCSVRGIGNIYDHLCTQDCIHFKPGQVVDFPTGMGTTTFAIEPRCRLWKDD